MPQNLPDHTSYAKSLVSQPPLREPSPVASTISLLNLQKHPEGGYFAETDRNVLTVPNPLPDSEGATRNASTTIFYLISPQSPVGHFHRNKARTVHTLHRGRGTYVLIHADEAGGGKGRVESFLVGQDLEKGEKLQWIVEGGKYKASYLMPDAGSHESGSGLLISETVVPGFEYADHDFLTAEAMKALTTEEEVISLGWLLNESEKAKLRQR